MLIWVAAKRTTPLCRPVALLVSDTGGLTVEHASAELKWWRQLQRFTGRREVLPETIAAVPAFVSDRMITW